MTEDKLCPSAKLQEGAILLGIVRENGRISYLNEQVVVDQTFVNTARQGRTPEKRFRFADTCVKSGCKQWTGSRCGVIDKVLEYKESLAPDEATLPKCSIRSRCRWFSQQGVDACHVCPIVVTDTRLEPSTP